MDSVVGFRPLTRDQVDLLGFGDRPYWWVAHSPEPPPEYNSLDDWRHAERLLREIVSPKQYAEWCAHRRITVPSQSYPDISYQIAPYRPVRLLRRLGSRMRVSGKGLCIGPRWQHPDADHVLTLYALCRWDEQRLWDVGNETAA